MARFWRWLEQTNQRTNLTRITGEAAFAERHALDALLGLPLLDAAGVETLVDVGSGCGVPGVPLALARPAWSVLLLESARRKATALEELCASVPRLTVRAARAEEAGRDPALREAHDAAVIRAVGSVGLSLELALPLVRPGGLCVLYRGPGDERVEAEAAAALLGGGEVRLERHALPSGAERGLLSVRKAGPTPARYPRRPGVPERRPLGGAGEG
ncbi:MAG: 16S rRNA (guanine(527)-N(7))-methyltransferase RsmG [Planctomycetota bacterium]